MVAGRDDTLASCHDDGHMMLHELWAQELSVTTFSVRGLREAVCATMAVDGDMQAHTSTY